MKKVIFNVLISMPYFSLGQITISNAENFEIGTVLVFQHCEYKNLDIDKKGQNQKWDFSKLKIKEGEKLTEKMISPEVYINDSSFSNANLIESYSDGRKVFILKTITENHLLGIVDSLSGMKIVYSDPMLFSKRPIKFGDSFTDKYSSEFSINGLNFICNGVVTLTADATGKLILPNGTFDNVLRVKITQTQNDILLQYGSENLTETISYAFFDKNHSSSLLKIDQTKSEFYNDKKIMYLVSEKK